MRFSPSSFDPDDPGLTGIACPPGWQWESCEAALRDFGSKFLLSRLPLFWQIEAPLNDACRRAGVTVFHNEIDNMPVGAAAIRSAKIDTVLTTADDAHEFVAYLFEKGIPIPRNWFVIHEGLKRDVPTKLRETSFTLAEEVHEYPGVPKV